MHNSWSIFVVVTLGLLLGRPAATSAAEEHKADPDAVRTAQRQLRNPNASQRVEAVKRLQELPALDAAKLIVPSRFSDPKADVRQAAYETLLAGKDDRDASVFLLKNLNKEIHSRKVGTQLVSPLLAVLLASDLPETQSDVSRFLDEYVGTARDSVLAITTVADLLGEQGNQQAVTSLQRMTKLKCFSRTFACRRAVIQALVAIRQPEAVGALVALLPSVDGEARGDIVRHLTGLSGEQYGTNAEAWQVWWKAHQDRFEFPAKAAMKRSNVIALPGTPAYYGLSIQARRMVFVIDISGSMDGPRLLAAERELIKAIQDLPNDAAFDIVAFNAQVLVWQRSIMPATPAAKQTAEQFVYFLRASSDTAAYDALEAAFRFDAEAIYFLSDGEPNAGKIAAPEAIIAAITEANRSRRISVYTVGIAPGPPGGRLDSFVKALAERNFGAYRRVDQ